MPLTPLQSQFLYLLDDVAAEKAKVKSLVERRRPPSVVISLCNSDYGLHFGFKGQLCQDCSHLVSHCGGGGGGGGVG